MFELDRAFEAYYDEHGFEEEEDGAENNPWVKYYEMFRRGANAYILPDGSIKEYKAGEMKTLRTKAKLGSIKSSTAGNWTHIGPKVTHWRYDHNEDQPPCPWQVNIYCFDIAASNPNILYCGTETGGVYKTADKGLNWAMVGNDFNFGSGILSIVVHPNDPDIIYVGAGSDLSLIHI